MLNTKEMEEMEEITNTHGLPSMLFGFNRLYLVNRKKDFLYEFNPADGIKLSNFELQKQRLYSEETKSTDPNQIDLLPAGIVVNDAEIWKKKDMSEVKDFKVIEAISDWTYSAPFKGMMYRLSE
jgi:hypothetical protein